MGYGVLRVTGNKAVMETMGVIDLRKYAGPYLKLGRIFERVTGIIESYLRTKWPSKRLSSAKTYRAC